MAISISLPLQAVQYIATQNIFSGVFNVPVPGKYSFNISGNENQDVLALELNSFYLIERLFVSGNLAAEDFLSSQDTATNPNFLPVIYLKRKINGELCHRSKIPIIQFFQNREAPIFLKSDKKGDFLTMSLYGILRQVPATVGLDPLQITIGLSIYQINEKDYNIGMRTQMSPEFGLNRKTYS